jgi:lipoprotein-anchoring transpeptidase ErfK/SrfK
MGRITTSEIYSYLDTRFSSKRIGRFQRDQIIILIKEVFSRHGPAHNNRWYRTLNGYVHSGYIQRIQWRYNKPASYIPSGGQLGEITVTSFRSMLKTEEGIWNPRYQLYFGSLHWITGIATGPNSPQPWYQITDDLLRVKHYIPATYVRLLNIDELIPISSNISPEEKRIEVSIDTQTLQAYERDSLVFDTKISSGLKDEGDISDGRIPTDTPTGRFRIGNKMPSRHMGDGEIVSTISDYELLGVPWVCYFHETGAAFHGTYWHDNFGRKMSHGCINMRNQDAKWLYLWTTPSLSPKEWYRIENGTVIDIY